MKKIAMLLAAGVAVGMLSGCGIPEDEHNMIIAELEGQHKAEVDKLMTEVADKDSLIKSEQAKVRQNRIELDDASARIKDLQQKSAETAKALAAEKSSVSSLESELKTAKSQAASAQDQAMEAESNYSTLDVEYQELKRRFEMFQKNLGAMSSPASTTSGSSMPTASSTPTMDSAPKSDAQKASSLLDQMGTL